jgi:hypothetical protein
VSFFESPPPPEPPEPPFEIPKPQPWWHAPGNELGAPVPLRIVLVRTDSVAVALVGAVAYSSGMAFTLSVRSRTQGDERFLEEPWEMPFGHHHLGLRQGGEVPPEILRFGVQFSDGRKATTLSDVMPFARPGGEDEEPAGPVLTSGGGGGSPGQYDAEFWLWPLPPPGRLAFAVEWPKRQIELTMQEVDAGLILEASKQSEVLWPDEPHNPGGVTANQIILRSVDEPDERENR